MARVRAGEVELGYELSGPESADVLVMINGLGGPKEGWRFQAPAIAEHFRVLTVDNRGVGESDKPDHQYTIPMFAADAANLMTALGIDEAHVLGGSMGGMIAQEFAIAFPYRVKSLILLYTTPGGSEAVGPRPEVLELWANRPKMSAEEAERLGAEFGYSKAFREANPELMEELIRQSLKERAEDYVFQRHLFAAMNHATASRLRRLNVPTLLLHGTDDWLLPHQNSEVLHSLIKGSRLQLFEGAGHALGIERKDEVNQVLIDWLHEHSSPSG